MGPGGGPGHQVAADVVGEAGQVAQVLERLGVPLAHHVGGGVVVEHGHQLPGVAEGVAVPLGGGLVVVHLIADVVPVGGQLVVVGAVFVLLHHRLGVADGGGGRPGLGGVGLVEVIGLAAGGGLGVVLGDGAPEGDGGHRARGGAVAVGRLPALGLVKPVLLVGAVHQQGGEDGPAVQPLEPPAAPGDAQARGVQLELRAGQLPRRHPAEAGLEAVVDLLLHAVQRMPAGGAPGVGGVRRVGEVPGAQPVPRRQRGARQGRQDQSQGQQQREKPFHHSLLPYSVKITCLDAFIIRYDAAQHKKFFPLSGPGGLFSQKPPFSC